MESTVYAGENVKAPKQEKQVNVWIGLIHHHLEEANKIQDELSSRLALICHSHAVPNPDEEEVHQELIPLASELRGIANTAQKINAFYRGIIESLEI